MKRSEQFRVSNPPPEAILIWDGDCRFCRLWVERWRVVSGNRVDDATFQQAAERFPEIPRQQFERAVVYIDTGGHVFTGAAAIFRSVESRFSRRWLAWSYDHVPGFGGISEFVYGIVARHRQASSAITGLLWGSDVRPPTYFRTRLWFLRGLGLVYLVAFISLWLQVDGLIGQNGILPIAEFLPNIHQQLGDGAVRLLPTLCWLNSSDAFLHFLCAGGVIVSLLLIAGVLPVVCLTLLFVSYLSLSIAGQTFFYFQWDILLLETGFLAVFFAPIGRWLTAARSLPVPRLGHFLLKALLFKLMFMSGVVKLTSGDDSWINLTALDYHYWSQPLPTLFAWFADKHPEWFKKFSVALCLVIEIAVPFFIWAPRRPRLIAATLLIALQIAIAITGNYCFFNLLTIVLCLLLIDDRVFESLTRSKRAVVRADPSGRRNGWMSMAQLGGATVVAIVTLPVSGWHIYSALQPQSEMPGVIAAVDESISPFRIVSGYGLFRVMTKDRREIIVEGSRDGIDWVPYEFKWKPGDPNRVPGWCAPHQPRLDWQMWFAALGSAQRNPWFLQFIGALLENKRPVTQLLASDPFRENGPVYVRARFYRYRFTSSEERKTTGAWWKREELGEYLPTVSIK
ncbi:MAG TPA: lipase maturation factor family protein [Chthoniobacterales bacterium]|nr:lipase maturation factor family protein [Chthoniobacterales bacterium]